MAVIRDQLILVGTTELTTSMNSISLVAGRESPDNTVLGNDTRTYEASGLKTVTAGGSGFYNATLDSALNTNLAVQDTITSFLADDAVGSVAYSFKSVQTSYSPLSGSVGDMHGFDFEAMGRADLVRGYVAYKGTVTSTGVSTAFQLGAVASGKNLYAIIHCTRVAGTSPTLDIDVNSDSLIGMGSPTTQDFFAQITGVTTEWTTTAGPITDTFYQLDMTTGGTDEEFDIAVILAVQ
jgi:hypothetical protein